MIVWIASFPRSGNTFLRMLLHHYYGFDTYSIYNDKLLKTIGADILVGQKELPKEGIEDRLQFFREDAEIYWVKTHQAAYKIPENDHAIYLLRDGRDAYTSYARLHKDKPFDEHVRTLMRQLNSRFNWSKHLAGWLDRPNTITVKFEDLIEEPIEWLDACMNFLNLEVGRKTSAEHPSFEDLHAQFPEFFVKGKIGSWKEEMSLETVEYFWEHHADGMSLVDYS